MESILNQLSNPFALDNFKTLINLYLECNDHYDFYAHIVSYHQDRDMILPSTPVTHHPFETSNFMKHWMVTEYFSNFFPTEHRIYINSSLNATSQIIQMFTDKCAQQNLPFEIKYAIEKHHRNDGIIIGSNSKVYKKHIDILRQIAQENPDLINQCGTPHILTASLDGWMGLADENVSDRSRSYTQSRLGIFDAAIKSFLINHPEYANQLEGFNNIQTNYNDYIEKGYSEKEISDQLCDSARLNKFKPSDLKTILENNDLAIFEIYELFINHLKLQGITPEMPTLYEGSKEALTHNENSNITIETQIDKKSPISIINDYFSTSEHTLDVQDELKLLKSIDEKFIQNNYLECFMFNELSTLIGQDFENQNIFENNLFNQIKSNYINFFGEHSFPNLANFKFPSTRQMIAATGKNISNEQAKEIINTRITQLHAYFNKPAETIEEKQKCIDTLHRMLEKYKTNNPNINYNIIKNFNAKIAYLEFSLQNHDALQEYYRLIASSLEEKTYTHEETNSLIEKCMPKEVLVNPYYMFEGEEPQYELEEIPEATSKDIENYENILFNYLHQNEQVFTKQDIGQASYGADTTLCIQADNVVKNIQRSKRNDHNR